VRRPDQQRRLYQGRDPPAAAMKGHQLFFFISTPDGMPPLVRHCE
jgi:hypothetical protein